MAILDLPFFINKLCSYKKKCSEILVSKKEKCGKEICCPEKEHQDNCDLVNPIHGGRGGGQIDMTFSDNSRTFKRERVQF